MSNISLLELLFLRVNVEFKARKMLVISAMGEALTMLPATVAVFLIGKEPKRLKYSFISGKYLAIMGESSISEAVVAPPIIILLFSSLIPLITFLSDIRVTSDF